MTQIEPILKRTPSDLGPLERERTSNSGTRLIISPQTQFRKEVSFRKTGTKIWEFTPEVTSYSLIEEETNLALRGKVFLQSMAEKNIYWLIWQVHLDIKMYSMLLPV
jgi:hypothetical protein